MSFGPIRQAGRWYSVHVFLTYIQYTESARGVGSSSISSLPGDGDFTGPVSSNILHFTDITPLILLILLYRALLLNFVGLYGCNAVML